MREQIIALAKKCDADIVGFAPASRFAPNDPIFRILPNVKTVIGLGFRILRGIFRGVEEGTTYYQYTTMGVENLEETVMPMALLRVANLIEEDGYISQHLQGWNSQIVFISANYRLASVQFLAQGSLR